ncbi:MAG: hypothetical protein LC126_07715 [Bryobacterales bacterium]|nr:hypothetical protein [Bryobacterales bacterium]
MSARRLDGIYVIRTSVKEALTSQQVVASYRSLSHVERACRSLKTVDLQVRPIRHRLPDRVRAHILLCMLACYVEWHMRQLLAPFRRAGATFAFGQAQGAEQADQRGDEGAQLSDAARRLGDDRPQQHSAEGYHLPAHDQRTSG